MKAAVLYGKQDIRYEDVQTPVVNDDEVLVKVDRCGICGSDVPRVNQGTAHYFPIILGHEFAGTIAEVGKNVTGLKIGQKCTSASVTFCGKCKDCLNGDYGLCKDYKIIGIWRDGAFAQYVNCPKDNIVVIDDKVDFDSIALIEPASVAHHGLMRMDFVGGDTIAVLGCGTIGLFAVQFAKIYGAKTIVAFDINDNQLKMAKELGADYTINTSDQNFMDKINEITNNRGFKYVIETAGSQFTMKLSFDIVEKKGKVSIVGTQPNDITFTAAQFELLSKKEFTLTGSRMSYGKPFPGQDWSQIAKFLKSGQLIADSRFITHRYSLSQIDKAFELYRNGRVDGKVMIHID